MLDGPVVLIVSQFCLAVWSCGQENWTWFWSSELKSQLCNFLTLWPWARNLTSLISGFPWTQWGWAGESLLLSLRIAVGIHWNSQCEALGLASQLWISQRALTIAITSMFYEDVKLSPRYQSRSRFQDLGVPKMMGARTTRSSWKRKSAFFYQCPHCSMTQGRAVLSPGHFVHISLYFRTAGSAIWWFTKGNWRSMISPGKCALWRCISLSRWDQDVEDATTSQAAQNLT